MPLVTGEAVAVELQHAKLASRAVAFCIDLLVQAIVLAILWAIALGGPSFDQARDTAVTLGLFVVVMVVYPTTFETLTRGRSLGKLALGLRVVRDNGGPIRFRHALVRALAGVFVDFFGVGLAGFVAVIVSLSSTAGKRVGDYLAGTVVIRVRVPQDHVSYISMPPQLAGWARSADLSQLPDSLALAVRQYLGRHLQLNPDASHALAQRLRGQVTGYVQPPPPEHTSSFDYLSAVLAERRFREERSLPAAPAPTWTPPEDAAPPRPQQATAPPPSDGPFQPPA